MATNFVSYLDAKGESIVSGPVPINKFLPGSANLFPKMINRINESAWELWQFDAVSANGKTGVTVSFFRDARTLDEGGFHCELNGIWPDGSMWGEKLYFAESIITAEGMTPEDGRVHGIWKTSSDAAVAATASFSIEANLSAATVHFSVPQRVTGYMKLHSLGSDIKSRVPSTEEGAMLGPSVHYIFPMGPIETTAVMIFKTKDPLTELLSERELSIGIDDAARGGMVRGWSPLAWPQIMTDAYYVCAPVGPYMLQFLRIVSSEADGRKPYVVARLYRDERIVCSAQEVVNGQSEDVGTQDSVAVVKIQQEDADDGLSGNFCDKNTGYLVDFKQGGTGRRWRFQIQHQRAWWSSPTSAPGPQGTGKSGFIEALSGGFEDETPFVGFGGGGQLQLP